MPIDDAALARMRSDAEALVAARPPTRSNAHVHFSGSGCALLTFRDQDSGEPLDIERIRRAFDFWDLFSAKRAEVDVLALLDEVARLQDELDTLHDRTFDGLRDAREP